MVQGKNNFEYPENFVRYLGTGGARFTMIHQYRATGGMWFRYAGLNGVIDPGPGSLVKICEAYPQLNPEDIRALILTHRHIDHSTDVNVLAEAMTSGGYKKQGSILTTHDAAFAEDPVLLSYSASKAENVYEMRDVEKIKLPNGITVEPVRHVHHGVDCFGLIFAKRGFPTWGVISDTRPLPEFISRYKRCKFISLNSTMLLRRPNVDHYSLPDAADFVRDCSAGLVTLSHLGRMIVEGNPQELVSGFATKKTRVLAARDGMIIDLDTLAAYVPPEKRRRKVKYSEI